MSNEYPKRARVGIYDRSILCARCDRFLGVWDQYGVELLCYGLAEFTPILDCGRPVAYIRASFDYERLKLFFMSVLWRAGESKHPFFQRVTLGPLSQELRRRLLAKDPGEPDDFGTILSAFTVDGRLPPGGLPIADPFLEQWEGTNAYRFSFGVVTAYIKVDLAPFGDVLARHYLRPEAPLTLIERDYGASSERHVAREVALAAPNRGLFSKRNTNSEDS